MGLALLAGLAGSSASPQAAQRWPATASSVVARITLPGAEPLVVSPLQGPPTAKGSLASYAYPQDGSVLTIGPATGAAAVDLRHDAAAGSLRATDVSLFGGEVTVGIVSARASASAHGGGVTGDSVGTALDGLVVLGQPVQATPGLQVPLGDWGQATLLESTGTPGTTLGVRSWTQSVTSLDVTLSADHGGLPAGSRIEIGLCSGFARLALASRQPAPPAPAGSEPPQVPPPTTPANGQSPQRLRTYRPLRESGGGKELPPSLVPSLDVIPRLTAHRYVFPVYGPAGYGDTFGAARADTGWHHGDDIFAPLGEPVLAVADGTVFSVGWQKVGGNRLWLRDHSGNEFYYAHLSAFSPLAANGTEVSAGDVLGFVGNSGDAEGTPYHLHFEVHPADLLFLGYDGVVDPTPYLDAWRRLEDLRFPAGSAWAPAIAPRSNAPLPGVILLQARDISGASGLDPSSLRRVLAPTPADGGGALVGLDRSGALRPASAVRSDSR